MESYNFFSVCVFDSSDQLYLRKTFDIYSEAIKYAEDLKEKYGRFDDIVIFVNSCVSLYHMKGNKER